MNYERIIKFVFNSYCLVMVLLLITGMVLIIIEFIKIMIEKIF